MMPDLFPLLSKSNLQELTAGFGVAEHRNRKIKHSATKQVFNFEVSDGGKTRKFRIKISEKGVIYTQRIRRFFNGSEVGVYFSSQRQILAQKALNSALVSNDLNSSLIARNLILSLPKAVAVLKHLKSVNDNDKAKAVFKDMCKLDSYLNHPDSEKKRKLRRNHRMATRLLITLSTEDPEFAATLLSDMKKGEQERIFGDPAWSRFKKRDVTASKRRVEQLIESTSSIAQSKFAKTSSLSMNKTYSHKEDASHPVFGATSAVSPIQTRATPPMPIPQTPLSRSSAITVVSQSKEDSLTQGVQSTPYYRVQSSLSVDKSTPMGISAVSDTVPSGVDKFTSEYPVTTPNSSQDKLLQSEPKPFEGTDTAEEALIFTEVDVESTGQQSLSATVSDSVSRRVESMATRMDFLSPPPPPFSPINGMTLQKMDEQLSAPLEQMKSIESKLDTLSSEIKDAYLAATKVKDTDKLEKKQGLFIIAVKKWLDTHGHPEPKAQQLLQLAFADILAVDAWVSSKGDTSKSVFAGLGITNTKVSLGYKLRGLAQTREISDDEQLWTNQKMIETQLHQMVKSANAIILKRKKKPTDVARNMTREEREKCVRGEHQMSGGLGNQMTLSGIALNDFMLRALNVTFTTLEKIKKEFQEIESKDKKLRDEFQSEDVTLEHKKEVKENIKKKAKILSSFKTSAAEVVEQRSKDSHVGFNQFCRMVIEHSELKFSALIADMREEFKSVHFLSADKKRELDNPSEVASRYRDDWYEAQVKKIDSEYLEKIEREKQDKRTKKSVKQIAKEKAENGERAEKCEKCRLEGRKASRYAKTVEDTYYDVLLREAKTESDFSVLIGHIEERCAYEKGAQDQILIHMLTYCHVRIPKEQRKRLSEVTRNEVIAYGGERYCVQELRERLFWIRCPLLNERLFNWLSDNEPKVLLSFLDENALNPNALNEAMRIRLYDRLTRWAGLPELERFPVHNSKGEEVGEYKKCSVRQLQDVFEKVIALKFRRVLSAIK